MDVFRATAVSLLTLVACSVGEVPSGNPDGGTGGGASFTAQVAPLVTECATAGCHGGAQAPNLTSFAALQAPYKVKPGSANILVTKGALTAGVHSGLPYFTAAEQATVAAWIDSL
jgi:hypothetical protein